MSMTDFSATASCEWAVFVQFILVRPTTMHLSFHTTDLSDLPRLTNPHQSRVSHYTSAVAFYTGPVGS